MVYLRNLVEKVAYLLKDEKQYTCDDYKNNSKNKNTVVLRHDNPPIAIKLVSAREFLIISLRHNLLISFYHTANLLFRRLSILHEGTYIIKYINVNGR